MSKVIQIDITDRIAKNLTPDVVVVCNNSDYVINFTFDDEWLAHPTKTARFVYNGTHEDVLFVDAVCPVPKIHGATSFKVGVFAGDLKTSTEAFVRCRKSILCEDGMPAAPSEDVYTKLVSLVESCAGEVAQLLEKIAELEENGSGSFSIDTEGNALISGNFTIDENGRATVWWGVPPSNQE